MRRLALLGLVVLLAACDSADDVVAIPGDVIVDVTADGLLRVSTESLDYCGVPLYVDSETRRSTVDVTVRGVASASVRCDALAAADWAVALPASRPVEVTVRHRGAADRYEVRATDGGLDLVALRTSTTRPGPR